MVLFAVKWNTLSYEYIAKQTDSQNELMSTSLSNDVIPRQPSLDSC